ncbi:MAG: YdcF family protein [Acidimicrobiales bacterium]
MFLFWPLKLAFRLVVLVVVGLVIYFLVTLVQVWLTSRHYDPQHAQAIVVMGAAQYNGVPSPDLRARLTQALVLYRRGYAPLIVVTGSKEKGDAYTEAHSGATFLESQGVPAADILEAGGNDSWRNLADAMPLLQARGVTTVLVVTDPFHEDRSMAIASANGLTPHPAPTQSSPIKGTKTVPYFLKESVGVGLGRIIGFQRLHALGVVTPLSGE